MTRGRGALGASCPPKPHPRSLSTPWRGRAHRSAFFEFGTIAQIGSPSPRSGEGPGGEASKGRRSGFLFLSGLQLRPQIPRQFHIRRPRPLGDSAEDLAQEIPGFGRVPVAAPEAGEVGGGAELQPAAGGGGGFGGGREEARPGRGGGVGGRPVPGPRGGGGAPRGGRGRAGPGGRRGG